jgi:predicted AAA+ superfamily ATPase
MKKYINRAIESIIKKVSKQIPVIAVTGPRQSGKSTMLRHLFFDYDYITFDNLEIRMRAKKDPALFIESFENPVIIDEIQYVPEVLSYIKIDVDKYTTTMRHDEINGKFILTGSQIFTLMAGLTETLAGRIVLFELLPFSFEELGNKPHEVLGCYAQLLRGFYPGTNTLELDFKNFYGSYLTTYIERDVRQIQNIKDISQFQSFLKLLAGRVGSLLNLQEIAKEVGIVHSTVKSWLSILENSRIIYILRPYFRNISKRVVKSSKIYFTDTGLLSHLLGYQTPETLLSGPASGSVFENMIVIDVLKNKFNHKGKEDLYFYRDSNGIEVDLVIEENVDNFILIEIKASKSLQYESVKQLMKIPLNSNKRMVLSLIDKKLRLNKDVTQFPWWEYIK